MSERLNQMTKEEWTTRTNEIMVEEEETSGIQWLIVCNWLFGPSRTLAELRGIRRLANLVLRYRARKP